MAYRVNERKLRIKMAEREIYQLEELARLTEGQVTTRTLRNWFKGEDFVASKLAAVASVLGCKPEDLTDYTPDGPASPKPEALAISEPATA